MPLIILLSLALYALMAVWAERKVSAWIQDRLGPTETGKYGLLQTFADIIKMLQKENIVPTAADKLLFILAPVLIFASVYMGYLCMPFFNNGAVAGINIGIFYIMAIVAIEVPGILLAGWASNNKYALLGAFRSVAQSLSYEIPAGLAIVSVIMLCQSMNLNTIALHQGIYATDNIYLLGMIRINQTGGIFAWHLFQAPHLIIAFIIFYIAGLAESNRAPFDIPEAESELVAGYQVEYTGFKFGVIFLAEYGMMLLISMILVVLFLGAWYSPLPNIGSFKLAELTNGMYWGIFWLLLKAFILVLSQMWVRWTLPRLRTDQLMKLCWIYLIPAALFCIICSGLYKYFV